MRRRSRHAGTERLCLPGGRRRAMPRPPSSTRGAASESGALRSRLPSLASPSPPSSSTRSGAHVTPACGPSCQSGSRLTYSAHHCMQQFCDIVFQSRQTNVTHLQTYTMGWPGNSLENNVYNTMLTLSASATCSCCGVLSHPGTDTAPGQTTAPGVLKALKVTSVTLQGCRCRRARSCTSTRTAQCW